MRATNRHGLNCLSTLVVFVAMTTSASLGEEPAPFNEGKWPFHPPRRPEVPTVSEPAWVANPIDAFILRALDDNQLRPNAAAERLTLLRRVTIDLTGLAPTLEEQRAFLADTSDDAYERLVDRLLDSPHYG